MLERRRAKRHRVRLDILLTLPAGVELVAELFDLSAVGCLLVSMVRLEPGEALSAAIPSMPGVSLRLRVVRSRPFGLWVASAMVFEAPLSEGAVAEIVRAAGEEPGPGDIL